MLRFSRWEKQQQADWIRDRWTPAVLREGPVVAAQVACLRGRMVFKRYFTTASIFGAPLKISEKERRVMLHEVFKVREDVVLGKWGWLSCCGGEEER